MRESLQKRPILIAGGGIGGLTLAIALRRNGRRVVVFEKTPELKEIGAAIALWPNATRVLRDLGLLKALEDRGSPITESEIRTWNGRRIKRWRIPKLETPALFVTRADLQSALASALPESCLRLNRTAADFSESPEDVSLRFQEGEPEEGEALVGADGLHSEIRNRLIGKTRPTYEGYSQWRALVPGAHPVLSPGLKMEWWGRGLRFGVAANGADRMNWYLSVNRSAPGGLAEPKDRLLEWVKGWDAPVLEILRATPETSILKTDIWTRPPSEIWGRGRVTLLGDAAHPTSPNLGQGAGMAIEDAASLAGALNRETDTVAALRRYETQRRRRTAATTQGSGLVGRMAQWSHPALVAARTAFLRAFPLALWERQLKNMYSYRAENP